MVCDMRAMVAPPISTKTIMQRHLSASHWTTINRSQKLVWTAAKKSCVHWEFWFLGTFLLICERFESYAYVKHIKILVNILTKSCRGQNPFGPSSKSSLSSPITYNSYIPKMTINLSGTTFKFMDFSINCAIFQANELVLTKVF